MSFARIIDYNNWIIDYDTESREYRVSYFEDGHFVDECRFKEFDYFQYLYDTDDEIKRMVDEFNNIPEEYIIPIEHWKRLGYTDEEAKELEQASKIYK